MATWTCVNIGSGNGSVPSYEAFVRSEFVFTCKNLPLYFNFLSEIAWQLSDPHIISSMQTVFIYEYTYSLAILTTNINRVPDTGMENWHMKLKSFWRKLNWCSRNQAICRWVDIWMDKQSQGISKPLTNFFGCGYNNQGLNEHCSHEWTRKISYSPTDGHQIHSSPHYSITWKTTAKYLYHWTIKIKQYISSKLLPKLQVVEPFTFSFALICV